MALKFLNKKGWHTGSLRNIETVWKAEQKHEGEQKKLEELRKQIQDEREKSEFRLMQEQAGLVPKQERLEFLYDSGLQVGKVAQADEYLLGKPVEEAVQPESDVGQVAAKPGALFVEEKPASANDSWRKLHSDPLFLIRQQEQAAIARIKSNPVKMAEIKKAAETKKKLKEEKKKKRKEAKRERREKKKRKKHHTSSSEDSSDSDEPRKDRKPGRGSGADGDASPKGRKAQTLSRNLSRSPSRSPTRSPTRSPVRKDRRQSPRKHRRDDLYSKGASKDQAVRSRSPSKSLRRSPVWGDHVQNRSRRDDLDEREHEGSDQRLTRPDHRDSEKKNGVPSRSPSRSPVRRRDYGPSRSRRDGLDSRVAFKRDGSQWELRTSDQRMSGSDDRNFANRKKVSSRNPSNSPIRSPVWRDVRRDDDQRLKRSEDQDFGKRKRVPSRSPSRSPIRRDVRRDHGQRLKRFGEQDFDKRRVPSRSLSESRSRSPVRRDVRRNDDRRLKGSEDQDLENRKRRVPSRSPPESRSRSPVRKRDHAQIRSNRGGLDSRDAWKGDRNQGDNYFNDRSLKGSECRDYRPRDSRESERVLKSNNGSANDLRNPDQDVTERKPNAEDKGAERKGMNGTDLGVPPKQVNRGRPPKPGQLSDAERAARLAEMQSNADIHEEQRWQRLKRAADADAVEVKRTEKDKSNEQFIADTQKSIFGTERVSASTIEKSVKRRAHFIERSSADNEKNAFRR